MKRFACSLFALFALVGCGEPEDTLAPFDVTLMTVSDCSQVGQGGVNCENEADLLEVSVSGRWVFDYRGVDTFIVTTHTGKSVAGVYFTNDGRVTTRSCQGEGGTCHFARTRFATTDEGTGCTQIIERVIDVVTADDGTLFGEMTDVAFTDETCGTSLITEVIVSLDGAAVEQAARVREGVSP